MATASRHFMVMPDFSRAGIASIWKMDGSKGSYFKRERSLFPSYSGFELPKYKLGHGDRRVRSHCGKLWAFRV